MVKVINGKVSGVHSTLNEVLGHYPNVSEQKKFDKRATIALNVIIHDMITNYNVKSTFKQGN